MKNGTRFIFRPDENKKEDERGKILTEFVTA